MRKSALILTLALLTQATLFYGFSRREIIPNYRPFDTFPSQLGDWRQTYQGVMADDEKAILRADDYIQRSYMDPAGHQAGLFVAFFKTQRYGQAPHSPKNCLPGNGWVWSVSDEITIDIPGRPQPITVNRYIISKGDEKSVVLYWYQSRDRVVASEYTAKIYVVADALRLNRTDTSLVRVQIPVLERGKEQIATSIGVEFIKSFFATLRSYLPT